MRHWKAAADIVSRQAMCKTRCFFHPFRCHTHGFDRLIHTRNICLTIFSLTAWSVPRWTQSTVSFSRYSCVTKSLATSMKSFQSWIAIHLWFQIRVGSLAARPGWALNWDPNKWIEESVRCKHSRPGLLGLIHCKRWAALASEGKPKPEVTIQYKTKVIDDWWILIM